MVRADFAVYETAVSFEASSVATYISHLAKSSLRIRLWQTRPGITADQARISFNLSHFLVLNSM
jgi:hypothetical protein